VYYGSPSSDWVRHPDLNCMEGFGAVDYLLPDGSEAELVGATLQQCIDLCHPGNCSGFKYKRLDNNKCFLRSYISLSECAAAPGQDVRSSGSTPRAQPAPSAR
jgi:hypothetical protein